MGLKILFRRAGKTLGKTLGGLVRRVSFRKSTAPTVPAPPSAEEARRSRTPDFDIPDELQRLLDSRQSPKTNPTPKKPPRPKKEGIEFGLSYQWTGVISSWIRSLRFVVVDKSKVNGRDDLGYVDMWTKLRNGRPGRQYRYGIKKLIRRDTYNRWRIAASHGKWWWRYVTRNYSPADRLT